MVAGRIWIWVWICGLGVLGDDIIVGRVMSWADVGGFEQRRRSEKVVAREARCWFMNRGTVYHNLIVFKKNQFVSNEVTCQC